MTIGEDPTSEPKPAPDFVDASCRGNDAPDWACDSAIWFDLYTPDAHAEHPGYEAAFSHPVWRDTSLQVALQALAEVDT